MSDVAPLRPGDVLGGLTGRRVSGALYAVESRAGMLAVTDRHAAAPAICEGMVATAERDYLAALRSGKELPRPPRIQHLERSADAWAHLVPASPTVRADLAHALTAKYPARASDVPHLRRAVGFDDPAVVAAHTERHGHPPDAGWARTVPAAERVRWWAARLSGRLERLPPFWSAFALTLTQTVGAGILALPIALAGVGPLPGLVLLVVLGLANVLTVTAIAESVTRTGTVRWGGAYIGGVVRQHLGRSAATATALALLAYAVASLTAYYIGLSSTLEEAVGLPAAVGAGALFAVTLAFVWRGRMGATITSALLVGALNLLIIALLVVAALTALEPDRLGRVELGGSGAGGFDASILGLVLGVVLMAYFGHTSVAAGARDILLRDPGGGALVRGTAAAMLTVILTYGLWVLAVGGAVDADRLAGERGTALAPLAETVGPLVLVLGTVFAISAMGMAAVHSSVGLHAQTAELLRSWGRPGRLPALLPLAAVFLLVETLLVTGRASFTAALGFVGTLAIPVVAGIVPVLLLASARRRGDYVPASGLGRAAGTPVLAVIWLLYLVAVVAHAAVIWTGPVERVLAALTALVILGVTVVAARSGAFRPLSTLEVRRDHDLGLDTLQLTTAGAPGRAEVTVDGAHGSGTERLDGALRLPELTSCATLRVPSRSAPQLRVWTHEVDRFGASSPLGAEVTVGDERVPPHTSSGAVTLPLRGGPDGVPVSVSLRPAGAARGGMP